MDQAIDYPGHRPERPKPWQSPNDTLKMFSKSELKVRKDMVVLNIDSRKAVICEGISRYQDLKDVAWEIAQLLGCGRILIYKK